MVRFYPPSTMAFTLLFLHNKFHLWENNIDIKVLGKDIPKITTKRYCDHPSSGKKEGWHKQGRKLYSYLCQKVELLRKCPETGKDFENKLKERFLLEAGISVGNPNGSKGCVLEEDDDDDDYDDFICPSIREKLEQYRKGNLPFEGV